jgi:hypothetical protein
MPLDIIKELDWKKHGSIGLIVAISVTVLEVLIPMFRHADPSCENQVKYLQQQNTMLVNDLITERINSKKKDTTIHLIDSAYHQILKPYKETFNIQKR